MGSAEKCMDRVRNEEVRRRAGIEMELASRADQRVLSSFGHVERMDQYHMTRRVLMVRLDGWCEGGLRQQRNVSGGCVTMSKRQKRVDSPGTYVIE